MSVDIKLTLLMADSDRQYLIGLCNYFRKFALERFNVIAFCDERGLRGYLEEATAEPDIILSGRCYIDIFRDYKEIPVILLKDDKEPDSSGSYFITDKFQSGEALANTVLDIYAGKSNYSIYKDNKDNSSNNCRTICVYSPQGGVGKTTISVSLASQLGLMGFNVFYLNIESICSTGSFFDISSNYNLSHIIYYLKNKRDSIPYKIRLIKKTDITGKISYFPPPINALEMEDLNAGDMDFLLKSLKVSSEYDFIIVDMSSAWNSFNTGVLKNCDMKLVIVTEDLIMQRKLNYALESLKGLSTNMAFEENDGLIVVKNKCCTKSDNEENRFNKTIQPRFNIPDFNRLLSDSDGYVSVSFNLHFTYEISLLGKEILEWRNYNPLSGN